MSLLKMNLFSLLPQAVQGDLCGGGGGGPLNVFNRWVLTIIVRWTMIFLPRKFIKWVLFEQPVSFV
jgi:hypothetical protein